MAVRRKGRSAGGRSLAGARKKSLVSQVVAEAAANDVLPAGTPGDTEDFFPPGFQTPELPPAKEGDLVTYFVQTDKKGLELYAPHAARYHQAGFRAVIVGPSTFTFDKPIARLVGRVRGDHFQKAVAWAKSNVVKDLHSRYLVAGGGKPEERMRTLKRYVKARQALVAHDEKRDALEKELEAASVGLVERFGKGPLEIEGATHDPSYVREKVYWKKRHVK
jgi:hypothetical protein